MPKFGSNTHIIVIVCTTYTVRHRLRLAPLFVVDVVEVVAVLNARDLRLRRHCQSKEKKEDGEMFIHDE